MSLSNFFGPNGSNSLCHLSWLEWYIRYLHCSFHNIYIPGSAKRLPPSFWMNWIVLGGWAPVVGRTFGEGWRGNQAGRSQRGPLFFRDDSVGWQNKPTILRPSFLGRNTLRFFMKNEGVVLFQSSLSSRFHKKMSCGILVLPYIVGGHSCSSARLHAGEEEGFPVSSYKPAAARSGWWRCGIAVGTVVCSLCDKEEIVCMLCQNAGRKFYNGRRHRANTAAGDQDEVTGCVDEQGEVFRYPRVPFDFSLTSGVIKWDPFEGRQTIQIYGKFEGFPIV